MQEGYTRETRRLNLRTALEEVGGVTRMAELLGKPSLKGHLSNAAKGVRGVGEALARDIEEAAGKPFGWMDVRREEDERPASALPKKQPIALENNPDYIPIRTVRFKLSAGASGFEVDYLSNGDGAPILFRADWYEGRGLRPDDLFAVRVAGASMEPGLYEGDVVVVDTGNTMPRDGDVFAVNYEGELVIKRLMRSSGQWWLTSDNTDQGRFPRKPCDEACIVLGRIVHKQSEHI